MHRRTHAFPAALVLIVLATLVAAWPLSSANAQSGQPQRSLVTRGTSTDDFELRTIAVVNTVRAKHGLRPIKRVVPCLDALSEGWGARMALEGLWEHRDMGSVVRGCRLSWTGETLARGRFTPQGLVGMWMDSPPHRRILLTARARLAGIDVRRGPDGAYSAVLNLGDRR